MNYLCEWAEKAKPVFIVGMARSGSTMVYNAFRNNPEFKIPCPDNFSPETFIFCQLNHKLPISFNPMLCQYLGNARNIDLFIGNFSKAVSPEKVRLERNKLCVKAISDTQDIMTKWQAQMLVKSFFYTASMLIGDKRVIEKTPSHSGFIDDIFAVFPNAKIIHCHRNMLNVLGSIRQRLVKEKELGHSPKQYEWLNKSVEVYVKQYNDAQSAYLKAAERYPGKILFASYEKIIKDPSDQMTRLCEFVGAEFSEKMVVGKRKGHAKWESYSKHNIHKNEYDLEGLVKSTEIKYINKFAVSMNI